jgi:prefoldin subunit 5
MALRNDATSRNRAAELKALRAELEQQLARLDFRSEDIRSALAKMAQHAERTIRRLLTT